MVLGRDVDGSFLNTDTLAAMNYGLTYYGSIIRIWDIINISMEHQCL